ncbi:hypothetical protein HMPREF9080_00888 [Cardiobacterium valvarum F0432]|uniref:Uncharacterized protein n=1 Tax=Cardiobacterium valvarum F0432 TaxID=797473 RepID=G9ZDQ4_9GAMM|nr:hypothetical protein HMPREF9080_00888 [Cardiobacterium valvarum F0432]
MPQTPLDAAAHQAVLLSSMSARCRTVQSTAVTPCDSQANCSATAP